jgi:hypothetical protein
MLVALGALADVVPRYTWQLLVGTVLVWALLRLVWRAMIRRPMELAATHWSRNPDKVQPKFSRTTHRLETAWVYENAKPTSALVRLDVHTRGREEEGDAPCNWDARSLSPWVAGVVPGAALLVLWLPGKETRVRHRRMCVCVTSPRCR